MSTARVFVGKARTGAVLHLVPKPGTVFPLAACGADVDRFRMHAGSFDEVTCRRCARIGAYSIERGES